MGGFARHSDTGVDRMIPEQQTAAARLVDRKAKTRSRVHNHLAEAHRG